MLILFGTRTINKKIGSTEISYNCKNCNNVSKWSVIKKRLWFTLFFIPTIPLHSEYICMCPVCNWGAKVKKQEALDMLDAVGESGRIEPAKDEASNNSEMFAE